MTQQPKVLVVEDDHLVSEVIAAALDDIYAVVLVETAGQALEVLREGGIRLMLLDCTLPGGIDVNLIPEADRAGAALILMSGDPGRIEKLVDHPRPFILKPFTLSGLIDKVEAVLGAP
jgi:DNA-binding NtrC family response regulator